MIAALALSAAVQAGLDVVAAAAGRPLVGKRVGLVIHAASVSADGRSALDVLRGHGVHVVRLFAPEHGLSSRAPAGEQVSDGQDTASGLPVVSLYGNRRRPGTHDLRDLDALVFDLQDAGVRFYTYASTMLLCLDAAVQTGIEMVVLDRPNPLGGERVEGPVADMPGSMVSMAPGPLVHGLTLGEMARFANARRAVPARLTVVPMRDWRRPMRWGDTGRRWVPPSPNLGTAEAALVYAGTALLEATNVSEGRGTETPFLVIGAPWLRPEAVPVTQAGFSSEALRFIPRSTQAAPDPKYRDTECRGLRIAVTDPEAARPYAFGLSLLAWLRRQTGFRWLPDGAAFDALVGTSRVRAALERGDTVEAILAADAPVTAAFLKERAPALLY